MLEIFRVVVWVLLTVFFLPPVCHGGVDDAGGLGQGVLDNVFVRRSCFKRVKKSPFANVILMWARLKTFCFEFLTCYRCFPLPWFLFIKTAFAVSVASVFVDAKLL